MHNKRAAGFRTAEWAGLCWGPKPPAPRSSATRARSGAHDAVLAIHSWCKQHIGQALAVTCVKDYRMFELWGDRAVQVEPNTGRPIGASTRGL